MVSEIQAEESQQYIGCQVEQVGEFVQIPRGRGEKGMAWLESKMAVQEDTKVNKFNRWDKKAAPQVDQSKSSDVYDHLEDHLSLSLALSPVLTVQLDLKDNALGHYNDYLAALSLGMTLDLS